MKCRSVACIWSGSVPPSHRVTATAVLADPPTLYTGASDGSLVWWTLSSSDSDSEFRPTAMLCGHAAPIADLDICNPIVEKSSSSNSLTSSGCEASYSAMFSACTDGVMCVWSRPSGHCRRRRKLPPWVGCPLMVRALPSKPRYVCVACCFVDSSVHLSDQNDAFDCVESGDAKRGLKCSVVIVDTYTLTVAQTVFHGNLLVGSLRFMAVLSEKESEKHSVVVSDSSGRVQMLSVMENLQEEREDGTRSGSAKSASRLEIEVWEEGTSECGQIVAMVICGNIVAFVLKSRCVFRVLDSGATIGEISFLNTCLYENVESQVTGSMFLEGESSERHGKKLVVWNDSGCLIVYLILYSNDVFTWKPLCEIPVDSCPHSLRRSTFTQSNGYIIRVDSVCVNAKEPLHWKPIVTIYSTFQKDDNEGNILISLRTHGSGSSFIDWTTSSYPSTSLSGDQGLACKKVVSSSMVIAETSFAPYGIVYGFVNGEIEVMRFDFLEELVSIGELNSPLSRQLFSGHTGAVTCLAAHHMVGTANGSNFNKVLVSGSKDCTVRIWDLDTGNIVTVLHQHVGPVCQIILPPSHTEHPWSDCFLSVGEDFCVALVSFETLRVERMFPGHLNFPAKVVWDGVRGYIACLCPNQLGNSDVNDTLYVWDVKTGARERVIRGTASHPMFDNFCKGITKSSSSNTVLNGNTSVSTLLLPIIEDGSSSDSHANNLDSLASSSGLVVDLRASRAHTGKGYFEESTSFISQSNKYAISCSCPFPGIATLSFDLESLMFNNYQKHKSMDNGNANPLKIDKSSPQTNTSKRESDGDGASTDASNSLDCTRSLEECVIRFSLSFLHSWDVDPGLDYLLLTEMRLKRPERFIVASGLQGDKGSLTLAFPDLSAILEIWKSSSEFCAMRSLTMVSLAQRMISLSHSTSSASSALAAFYTRNFAEKFPDIKPPLLQLLVSFWQDESEHIRMAARTLFHCAASRAIPSPLCDQKSTNHENHILETELGNDGIRDSSLHVEETSPDMSCTGEVRDIRLSEQSNILAWLESFEMQDWISCVGGTSQDAMTSHIIIAAALAIWYPILVKPSLATLVVHPLMKLVVAMNEKYSSTAAELLAEGMESTWKACIGLEIPQFIEDIFFQIECVSGSTANAAALKLAVPNSIRETLAGILLPSLAMADVHAFLTVIESQVWSTASDSPVHLVSLMTLMRVVRGYPKSLVQYLDKVVSFILQTMDPSNSVMRKACFQTSMTALKEVVHAFPMVAINETWTRLAIGDAFSDIKTATIRVYDMQSVVKIKVLDAGPPPGLPTLLAAPSETAVTTAISALSFSPDGEGLIAFSEHGLMIRWWSLGSVWWEKLTRNLNPIQYTKLIFVPPWEGFSPTSSRSSIMGSVMGHDRQLNIQDNNPKASSHPDNLKLLIHKLDLSYRLQWVGDRKVLLTRHGHELGTFQL